LHPSLRLQTVETLGWLPRCCRLIQSIFTCCRSSLLPRQLQTSTPRFTDRVLASLSSTSSILAKAVSSPKSLRPPGRRLLNYIPSYSSQWALWSNGVTVFEPLQDRKEAVEFTLYSFVLEFGSDQSIEVAFLPRMRTCSFLSFSIFTKDVLLSLKANLQVGLSLKDRRLASQGSAS